MLYIAYICLALQLQYVAVNTFVKQRTLVDSGKYVSNSIFS
jgi:hypothetical protein